MLRLVDTHFALRKLEPMHESEPDEVEESLSPWEQEIASALEARELPRWDHKAKAATFAQGHRGLLDLDLDFPAEYLKGPAPLAYVWRRAQGESMRVHSYVDIDGRCFHVQWEEESETGPQQQPVHAVGLCNEDECQTCVAVSQVYSAMATRNG